MPTPSTVPPETAAAPLRAALSAARANVLPGILLQLFALAIVAAYFLHGPTRTLFTRVEELRAAWGLWFPILSTALFGGLLPALLRAALRRSGASPDRLGSVAATAALTIYWGVRGIDVHYLYELQAVVFGDGRDWGTILAKTLVDQALYCPLLAVPATWVAYAWVGSGFSWSAVVADWRRPGWLARNILPVLIANWGVWIPAVAIIYVLPTPLQLPLQNVVLLFYTLLVMFLARR